MFVLYMFRHILFYQQKVLFRPPTFQLDTQAFIRVTKAIKDKYSATYNGTVCCMTSHSTTSCTTNYSMLVQLYHQLLLPVQLYHEQF